MQIPSADRLPIAFLYITWIAIFLASCSLSLSTFPNSNCHPEPKQRPHIVGLCYVKIYFPLACSLLLFQVSFTSLEQARLNLFSWPWQGSKKAEILVFFQTSALSWLSRPIGLHKSHGQAQILGIQN